MDVLSASQLPTEIKNNLPQSPTSKKLRSWSTRCSSLSKKLAIWIVVIGIFAAVGDIFSSEFVGEVGTFAAFAFSLVVYLIPWILYAVVEFFVCQALSIILQAFSEIVQNTYDTRNMAVLTAAKSYPDDSRSFKADSENSATAKATQTESFGADPEASRDSRPTPWVCPKCCGWNSSKDVVCFKCKSPRK